MTESRILEKIIAFSDGNLHDIQHLLKVHAYASLISDLDKVDPDAAENARIAAMVHDIAIPLCRRKYGNTCGPNQEKEGYPMTKEFLRGTGLSDEKIERIAYLVGHHHTLTGIDGLDWQILIEADYLVNAAEQNIPTSEIKLMKEEHFRTPAGLRLIEEIFGV